MQQNLTLSASKAFELLCDDSKPVAAIDVRSSGEFAKAHFSGSSNQPILNDEHKHLVGLTYKQKGADEAEKLGHELVSGDYKEKMIQGWLKTLQSKDSKGLVYCWRGGLRSRLAQEWILQTGQGVLRIEGGYKALRKIALEKILQPRNYLILGGPTGSGKTVLLNQASNSVDLEGLANHRGSVFGLRIQNEQPTQANFENNLAQALFKKKGPVLLEDESRLIGKRSLDLEFYNKMAVAPMVLLKVKTEERAQNIYKEYIVEAKQAGHTLEEIHAHYSHCIEKIRKSLGGLQSDSCLKLMDQAFSKNDISAHLNWITFLLESYYDKRYSYTLEKKERKTIHQGDHTSCLHFLQEQAAQL